MNQEISNKKSFVLKIQVSITAVNENNDYGVNQYFYLTARIFIEGRHIWVDLIELLKDGFRFWPITVCLEDKWMRIQGRLQIFFPELVSWLFRNRLCCIVVFLLVLIIIGCHTGSISSLNLSGNRNRTNILIVVKSLEYYKIACSTSAH